MKHSLEMKHSLFVRVFLLLSLVLGANALAQDDNPVSVRVEIFAVSQVGGEETFAETTTARPGQVIEYRLFARNDSETTLPAGTVFVTGPVPDGTTFVANSATPKDERVLTEFSVDGETFGEPPLVITPEDGERRTAEPAEYTAARWTLLEPLEPGNEVSFVYRVTVEAE